MPAGVGVWDKATRLGREVRRGQFVGFTEDVGMGCELVFCCNVRDETKVVGLWDQRKKENVLQVAYLVF